MKRLRHGFKKYFIPHPENGHKPHLLRLHTVVFVCALMVAAEILFLAGPSYLISRSKLFGVIMVNALVDGTNQARAADKLPALRINPLLQAAAQEKADDMAAKGYFAHTSPSGLTPWYWFGKVGYDFSFAGENLAVNFSDSQDVTDAWMDSPGHRANILNGNYTEIGIATARGEYEGHPAVYVAQLFGSPAGGTGTGTGNQEQETRIIPATAISKPKPIVTPIPAAAATASSGQASVAVKGAETNSVGSPTSNLRLPTPLHQNNLLQNAVAAPHSLADDFYLFIIGLFAAALALNIFIKVRIQHPQLILSGVIVIAFAVVFLALNQHGALAGVKIE